METPGLKKAMTTLEFLSQNKEARMLYEMRKKALLDEQSALDYAKTRGREEGWMEGKMEGKQEGKAERQGNCGEHAAERFVHFTCCGSNRLIRIGDRRAK
ncbi:MAG: hypothetical protein K0R28_2943 [Paenibacillus sp.]|nr:hypothetical protein [Paenibacillus sp.]